MTYHCPNCGKSPFSGIESARVIDKNGIVHVLCAKCTTKYEYEESQELSSLFGKVEHCPVCGRNPHTGTKPVFPTTDGEYIYIVCGHCSTHYEYKNER